MPRFHFCSTDSDTPCAFTDATLAKLSDRGWGDIRCIRHGCLMDGGTVDAPTRREAHRTLEASGSDEYRDLQAREASRRQRFRPHR